MHSEMQKKRKRNGDNSEQKMVKKRLLFPPSLHKKKKKRKRRKTTLAQSFPQKETSISPDGALFPPAIVWKPLFTPEDLKPQPHFPPEKRVTREKYKTTADSKNRIENREELESQLKLPEFGLHKNSLTITDEMRLVLFRGYERVVYGDHGPYLELMHWNIHWEKFHESSKYKPHTRFYDELLNPTESVLLYAQVRDVKHRWNPPNGERSVFNNRKDGYADCKFSMLTKNWTLF